MELKIGVLARYASPDCGYVGCTNCGQTKEGVVKRIFKRDTITYIALEGHDDLFDGLWVKAVTDDPPPY